MTWGVCARASSQGDVRKFTAQQQALLSVRGGCKHLKVYSNRSWNAKGAAHLFPRVVAARRKGVKQRHPLSKPSRFQLGQQRGAQRCQLRRRGRVAQIQL